MNEDVLLKLERLARLKNDGAITQEEFDQQKAALLNSTGSNINSVQVTSTPPVTSKPVAQKSNKTKIAVGIIVFLAVVGLLNEAAKVKNDESVSTTVITDTTSGITAASTPIPAVTPGSNWSYYDGEDKMGRKFYTASVEAKEQLDFEFPYNGGSTASITIRKNRGNTDVALRVSKGQFIVHPGEESIARIKLDDSKPVTFSLSGAADYSSDVVFFNNESRLIAKMKGAKRMIVEVEFYQEGVRQIEFDISALKWKH